ncbi:DMT family transporter [Jannaschia sp. S6380]|uniref:DMT family transporter n=1 Tax=Jannaschia sp. S6380 TaxID=2926408 RepID=UPI001FF620CF|nr:DMT family transporter [Jannaschia sp. S6380]MCK0168806.1 DMT family transporter [Jannaschia sp. S6380]
MPSTVALPIALIIIAGGLAALQAPMNAALGRSLGSPVAAAAISFGVGFAALLTLTFALGHGAMLERARAVDARLLLGGLLGAFYVWATLWAVPVLGIVTAVSGMILGQIVIALILDAFGPFGLPTHAITPTRLAAGALVACGLILSRL